MAEMDGKNETVNSIEGAQAPPVVEVVMPQVTEPAEPEEEAIIASYASRENMKYKVKLYELTNYAQDGRSDAAASKEFLDTLPITDDLDKKVKDSYGPGAYRLEFYKDGKFYRAGLLLVRGEPGEELPAELPATELPASPQKRSAIEELIEFGKTWKAAERIFAREQTTTQQPDFFEQYKKFKELEKILREEAPEQSQKTVGATGWDVLSNLVGNLIQSGPDYLSEIKEMIALSRMGAGAPGATVLGDQLPPGVTLMRPTQPAPGAQNPAANNQEEESKEKMKKSFDEVLRQVRAELEANAPVEKAAQLIREFLNHNETYKQMFEQMLSLSVDMVLMQLNLLSGMRGIKNIAHAKAWVEQLQAALKPTDEAAQ